MTPLGSTGHVSKTMQFWRVGEACMLRSTNGPNERYTRAHFLQADDTLMSMHVYEEMTDVGWDVTAIVPTVCVRTTWD